MLATVSPFPQYFDLEGKPLDSGELYFGVANDNPETNPITVYWDAAGTQPADQPIRTVNGYPVRAGAPAQVYSSSTDYSMTCKDRKGRMVFYAASSLQFSVASLLQQYKDDIASAAAGEGAGLSGFDWAIIPAAINKADWGIQTARNGTSVLRYIAPSLWAGIFDGTGTTDLHTYIQTAVDALSAAGGGALYMPSGTYRLGAVNYIRDDGSTVYGITSIKMKDGVHVYGDGPATILKVKAGAYGSGAFYRAFSSRDATRLSRARISDLTIDGNSSAQTASTQCSNIVLECADDVSVQRVRSINANGNGIMLRGTTTSYATNLSVLDCVVQTCTAIGIQISQGLGFVIEGNQVSNTTDNCIDVYGEDGDSSAHAKKFSIVGNTCDAGPVGIFLETLENGTVAGNAINACTFGLTVNRINGQPNGLLITGNISSGCATGIRGTGDTGGVAVYANYFNGYSVAGVQLGALSANCSYWDVSQNFFTPSSNTVPTILTVGNTVSFCTGKNNTVNSSGITAAYLYTATASTHVAVRVDSFKVLPYQVGRDVYGYDAEFLKLTSNGGKTSATAGPVDITIDDNTHGFYIIGATKTGVGSSSWLQPFAKRNGTLTLGTPIKSIVTADPTTSVTVVSNNMRVTLGGASTDVTFGPFLTPF